MYLDLFRNLCFSSRRSGLPDRQFVRDLAWEHLDERPRGGEGPLTKGGRDRDGFSLEERLKSLVMLEGIQHLAMPLDALAHLGAAPTDEVDDPGPPTACMAGALPR